LDAEQAAAYRYGLDHALSPTESSLTLGFGLYNLRIALQAILDEEREVEEILAEMMGQIEAGQEAVEKEAEPVVVATARPEEPAEKEGERIVFVPRAYSAEADVYKNLAEVFHHAHPDIVVEILPDVAGGGRSVTGSERLPLLAGESDCFRIFWQMWYPEDRAHFLPLDPLVEADASFSLEDFYVPAVDAVRLDRQLWPCPRRSTRG
jgi:hypothetical protein